MLLLNLGYKWTLQEVESVNGVLLLPCGNSLPRIQRENQPHPTTLFDPQLYLAQLDAQDASKVCARLASYPWFNVPDLPVFDSSEMTRSAWDQAMREAVIAGWPGQPPNGDDLSQAAMSAVDFQQSRSCSQIILPGPLIVEREDEAATMAEWLDAGVGAASELEVPQPLLATVALDEAVINEAAFAPAGFLDAVVDQVTAREGINGVYIVIAQSSATHPFEASPTVFRAYAHLVKAFSEFGYDSVLTNFADVFGLVCGALGATGFSTGPSQSLRRLSLGAFSDSGQGRAYPYFYSHRLIAELATETDLDRIVAARLLSRVRDRTAYSQALMEELGRPGSARNLANWAENQNNTTASHKHFVSRMGLEDRALLNLPPSERVDRISDWLQGAASTFLYIRSRLDEGLKGRVAPAQKWLDIFESIA